MFRDISSLNNASAINVQGYFEKESKGLILSSPSSVEGDFRRGHVYLSASPTFNVQELRRNVLAELRRNVSERPRDANGRSYYVIDPTEQELGYCPWAGFVPARSRILHRIDAIDLQQPRCAELINFLLFSLSPSASAPIMDTFSIRDLENFTEMTCIINEHFAPSPSDRMSVVIHAAMLNRTEEEICDFFRNGTINSQQSNIEREKVYNQIIFEHNQVVDEESYIESGESDTELTDYDTEHSDSDMEIDD